MSTPYLAGAMSRRTVALAVAAILMALALVAGLAPPVIAAKPAPVTVSVQQPRLEVLAAPCGVRWLDLTIANTSADPLYVDVYIAAESPVQTSHDLISTYLPANDEVTARVQASAPSNAVPGTYDVAFTVGRRARPQVEVPVTVVPRPSGPGANLALGGPATASSTHGNFSICGAADGNKNGEDWSITTGWNDGTRAVFPDWFAVQFPEPVQVGRVVLNTLDSSRYPARSVGLRDWDVQVLEGEEWRTVASVRGNTTGTVASNFEPVTTPSIRILALASNDSAYSRIVELEAYAE